LQYWRFDPAECRFPRPQVPVLPSFPAGMPGLGKSTWHRSSFLGGQSASYSRGRYALTAVLRSLGVGLGKTVLIPAYHCRTMIDPVLRLCGTPVLFPLQPDLTPDWAGLDACVAASAQPVALLLPHFFGFPQPVEQVRAWCDQNGVAYVEDCSHALFGELGGKPIGSFGDAAIASPYKFFACEDGGLARGAKVSGSPRPAPRLEDELRGVWGSMQKLLRGAGKKLTRTVADDEAKPCGVDVILDEVGISSQYDSASEARQALRWSRLIMNGSSIDRISLARRRNYLAWLAAVSDVRGGCRPQFPILPDTVVPYMFPLWLDDPARVFFRLKRAGLPIFRWDELAVSNCAVSRSARLGLIHLPCHQGVGQAEMDWMLGVLHRALQGRGAA
jgi:perosamine synthetase